jgi:hypothetical protein
MKALDKIMRKRKSSLANSSVELMESSLQRAKKSQDRVKNTKVHSKDLSHLKEKLKKLKLGNVVKKTVLIQKKKLTLGANIISWLMRLMLWKRKSLEVDLAHSATMAKNPLKFRVKKTNLLKHSLI